MPSLLPAQELKGYWMDVGQPKDYLTGALHSSTPPSLHTCCKTARKNSKHFKPVSSDCTLQASCMSQIRASPQPHGVIQCALTDLRGAAAALAEGALLSSTSQPRPIHTETLTAWCARSGFRGVEGMPCETYFFQDQVAVNGLQE